MRVIADAPRERGSPGWKVLRRTAPAGLTIPLLAGQIWKTASQHSCRNPTLFHCLFKTQACANQV
jgi:hypothetical protein